MILLKAIVICDGIKKPCTNECDVLVEVCETEVEVLKDEFGVGDAFTLVQMRIAEHPGDWHFGTLKVPGKFLHRDYMTSTCPTCYTEYSTKKKRSV